MGHLHDNPDVINIARLTSDRPPPQPGECGSVRHTCRRLACGRGLLQRAFARGPALA